MSCRPVDVAGGYVAGSHVVCESEAALVRLPDDMAGSYREDDDVVGDLQGVHVGHVVFLAFWTLKKLKMMLMVRWFVLKWPHAGQLRCCFL